MVGVLYGIISAVTLAILIIYGSEKSKEFGGLNVAFIQVLFAGACLSPFTFTGFSWMVDNLAVSIFLGFFPNRRWTCNLLVCCKNYHTFVYWNDYIPRASNRCNYWSGDT
jgi:hypothetical protein